LATPFGIGLGLFIALYGVATLDAPKIGAGLDNMLWALVPRYGFWSGPGWGQPSLDLFHWWPGPFSQESVIESATYAHDQHAKDAGADRQLIHDVWARHDIGPYGQVYRVGLTALFGTGIALGMDD